MQELGFFVKNKNTHKVLLIMHILFNFFSVNHLEIIQMHRQIQLKLQYYHVSYKKYGSIFIKETGIVLFLRIQLTNHIICKANQLYDKCLYYRYLSGPTNRQLQKVEIIHLCILKRHKSVKDNGFHYILQNTCKYIVIFN